MKQLKKMEKYSWAENSLLSLQKRDSQDKEQIFKVKKEGSKKIEEDLIDNEA